MSNAKRAIMVPVMTLAVCAIAMVGLGFALSSSVTSQDNDVEDLMIDMSKSLSYFQSGGSGQFLPSTDDVDELLSITLKNDKTDQTPGIVVTGGAAYLKVYGNIASGITLNVKASGNSGNTPTHITLSIYNQNAIASGPIGEVKYGNTDPTFGTKVTFQKNSTNTQITCETVYIVAITEINGYKLSYTESGGSLSGSLDVAGTQNITANTISMTYAFEVTNDPTSP